MSEITLAAVVIGFGSVIVDRVCVAAERVAKAKAVARVAEAAKDVAIAHASRKESKP